MRVIPVRLMRFLDLWPVAESRHRRMPFGGFGWLKANLDPLGLEPDHSHPDLDTCGLSDVEFSRLCKVYCGPIGWEFGHLQDPKKFNWLAAAAETSKLPERVERLSALSLIAKAEMFERSIGKRLPMVKTFGLSGSEGFLVAVEQVIRASGRSAICVGGMHRGRLTQLALLFNKPLADLIAECRGGSQCSPIVRAVVGCALSSGLARCSRRWCFRLGGATSLASVSLRPGQCGVRTGERGWQSTP